MAQEWTGEYYRRIYLRELGFVVKLGHHGSSTPCPLAHRKVVVVLHLNGIHEVVVDICGCRFDCEPYQQFLRASWFPATPLFPETCATFELLELFHLMNLQGNLTVYDFCKVLESRTDGWRLRKIPVRDHLFQWAHTNRAVLGSTSSPHKYDTRVEEPQNAYPRGSRPLPRWNLDHGAWRTFRPVSRLLTPRNQRAGKSRASIIRTPISISTDSRRRL